MIDLRVLIADDHPVVRQGIRQIVAATDDITVVDEATTGHETLQRLADVQCDLVLLDLSLPDIDGLDLLKQLKREHPQRPILILTMHSEDQFALRALKAGASGYLTKESAPAELVGAVRKVVAGGRYISSSQCMSCHGGLNGPFGPTMFLPSPAAPPGTIAGANVSPYGEWRWSPMGLAGRDPIFFAQVESELAFRVSLYAARFLAPGDASERTQIFDSVKRLYKLRSAAVHGARMRGDARDAVEESAQLTSRLLRQCVLANHMPRIDELVP